VRRGLQKWLLHPATIHWRLAHFPAFVEQAEVKIRHFLQFLRALRGPARPSIFEPTKVMINSALKPPVFAKTAHGP
jgi:hypothetical protein